MNGESWTRYTIIRRPRRGRHAVREVFDRYVRSVGGCDPGTVFHADPVIYRRRDKIVIVQRGGYDV